MCKLRVIVWIGALVWLVACGSTLSPLSPAQLQLQARLSMDEEGQAHIRIGASNVGGQTYAATNDFGGLMELKRQPGDELRSRIEARAVGPIKPGEQVLPSELKAYLEAGSYELVWSAPGQTSLTLVFSVLEEGGKLLLLAPAEFIDPYTPFTLSE